MPGRDPDERSRPAIVLFVADARYEALRAALEQRSLRVLPVGAVEDAGGVSPPVEAAVFGPCAASELRAILRQQAAPGRALVLLVNGQVTSAERTEALDQGADLVLDAAVSDGEIAAQIGALLRARSRLPSDDLLSLEFQAVLNAMSDGVAVFDLAGRVVLANEVQARIGADASGPAPNLDRYASVFEVLDASGSVLPLSEWPVARALRGEAFQREEHRCRRTDIGREWTFEFSGGPVFDSQSRRLLALVITRDITERRQAQQHLLAAKTAAERDRAQREAIFRSMSDGLVVFDASGHLLDMNPAALAMHRFPSLDAIRMHLAKFPALNVLRDGEGRSVPLDQWPIARALRGETFSGYEVEVIPTDGSPPWFGSYGGAAVRDEAGHIVAGIVTIRDITRQKQSERLLRSEREFIQRILDKIPVMIAIYDPKMQHFRFNQEFRNLLGWTEQDAADGSLMTRLYPAEPARRAAEEFMGSLAEGWREFTVRAKDGSSVESVWANVRLNDGFQVGIGLDVRARKRTELALRQSEERFRTYAETMPHLAFVTDRQGRLVYHNRRFADYFGISLTEAAGWTWGQRAAMYAPEEQQGVLATWKHALEQGRAFEMEYRLRRRDGEYRWHLTRALPLQAVGGQAEYWIGTSTDIDDQKQISAELAKARDELAAVNTNLEGIVAERTARLRESIAELEHFSYTITHDLRAPLRAMRSFGDVLTLQYGTRLDDAGRDYLRRITEAAARMDRLITDALSYSRAGQSEYPLEPVEPEPLLRSMVESYPELEPLGDRFEIAGPLPPIRANSAGLTQCFSNLLLNAVKFAHPDRPVRVRVRPESRHGRVRLWFEDNGIGIPAAQQERIFGMFQKLNPSHEGTGVGLALVRKVAGRMQGAVGVEAVEGEGSRFWLEFPKP